MKKRTFTKTITYPAGTLTAGVYEEKVTLDSQFDRATGVAAYINKGGGLPTLQLGLRNDSQVYVQPTNIAYFQADASCPKNQRMTAVQIMCDKTETTIVLVLPAANNEDFSLDVVFELEG